MKRPRRGAVVIVEDGHVALIKRVNDRGVYYLFPGGGVEAGETSEEAAVREAQEELGLHVRIVRLLGTVEYQGREQLYFLAETIDGEFGTGTGREMSSSPGSKAGTYRPVWLPVDRLRTVNVRPPMLADQIAEGRLDADLVPWRVEETRDSN